MALKSVYEVEVNTEAFEVFQAMFQKHQDAVKAMPGAWGQVGKAAEGATATFDDLVRAAQITAAATASIALQQDKVSVATKSTDRAAESLVKHTAGVARNIKEATTSLLAWTGILGAVGGLLGAGGIWGIDRMAGKAAGERKQAGGLGITSGENQAFKINYGRSLGSPDSFLENVANVRSDMENRWAFGAMGIFDDQSKSVADLAPEVAARARQMFMHSDRSQQSADATGLTKFESMDDLRRAAGMSDAEFNAQNPGYQNDRNNLAVAPDTQRAWTDFTAQMQRAGTQIENTFITGLVPLAAPLEHLSASFTDLVAAFLKAPQIKEWMGEVGDGLEEFSKFIGTPAFKQDVNDFISGVEKLARGIWAGVTWIEDHLPDGVVGVLKNTYASPAESADGALPRAAKNFRSLADEQAVEKKTIAAWLPNAQFIPRADAEVLEHQYAQNAGLPKGFGEAIFKIEGGLNPDGSPRVSSAGAIGAGQLMPGTALDGRVNPYDTRQNIVGSVMDMQRLYNKYGDTDKAAAAYNWGEGNLGKDIREHGDKWRDALPPETKKYLQSLAEAMARFPNPGSTDVDSDVGKEILRKHYDTMPKQSEAQRGAEIKAAVPMPRNDDSGSPDLDMARKIMAGTYIPSAKPAPMPQPTRIQINNATGGSAVVSANSAAVQ